MTLWIKIDIVTKNDGLLMKKMSNTKKILILTPVKNASHILDSYFANLSKINYSHDLISIGLLESDSCDGTFELLEKQLPKLEKEFRKACIFKKDFGFQIPEGIPRWAGKIQIERRKIIAKSRNHLLFRALGDEDWVLWLDVDVSEYPPDIIERLLATGKEIVHPNCVLEYGGKSYDLNAWRDKKKYHLHDLRQEGDLVELHAVGGTMLLVKAEVHRDGLIFPPYLYGKTNPRIRKNNFWFANWKEWLTEFHRIPQGLLKGDFRGEIETEGLGIMANDMGYKCWGLPNLEIKHRQD